MKIVLAPAGTRGDVEPLVALGLELKSRKHDVLVCAPADYIEFVRSHGLHCELGTPSYRDFLLRLSNTPFLDLLAEQTDFQFEHLMKHTEGADAIVGLMLQLAGPSLAEHRKIPYFTTLVGPVFVRSSFHPPANIRQNGTAEWNLEQWAVQERDWNAALLEGINGWRSRLRLDAIRNARAYVFASDNVLFAWEQALSPPPSDAIHGEKAGTFFLDSGELDEEVVRFCSDGPERPIFIGFGSMVAAHSQLDAILEAVQKTGRRAVIGGHANSKGKAPSSCLLISGAPFWRLFPLCSAIVHHGGSGTTAVAARAGVPQAIIPQWSDQYFWADRIVELRLGPRAFPIEELDTAKLAALLSELDGSDEFRSSAKRVGLQIDPPRGVRRAADAIERAVEANSGSKAKASES